MTDPDWTPDEAYLILRRSLERFMATDAPVNSLHLWLTVEFATPPDTPSKHPVQLLYKLALTDVAVYLQGDFDRADLVESLQGAIALVESGEGFGFTKITRSPCFFALVKNGQVPAPLINVTDRNRIRRLVLEGFREL